MSVKICDYTENFRHPRFLTFSSSKNTNSLFCKLSGKNYKNILTQNPVPENLCTLLSLSKNRTNSDKVICISFWLLLKNYTLSHYNKNHLYIFVITLKY